MGEQPVWEEFLERMEATFKEYLENLDIGYVIQNFLERFNLEDYLEIDHYVIQNFLERFNLEDYLERDKAMKEDKKIDLDKAFKIITDLELWNEDNIVELRTHEVFSIIQASTMKLRKALGDE